MDTQLFSTLLGGIAPSAAESPRLYSSWSTCEDEDHVSAVALQGGTEERYGVFATLWHFLKIPLSGMLAAGSSEHHVLYTSSSFKIFVMD